MKYDIFLVNALADSEMAEMLVRRLKALKFKVRHDKKRAHTTPTPKDIKDANDSQSVIVLWSKEACDTTQADSDWVHAMAHQARSRKGVLVQVGLDDSVPDEPFHLESRYMLAGLTSRKTVDDYYGLVDDLGNRDGRKDLRAWIDMKTSDKDGREAWKKAHPTDPLALVGQPKPKPVPKPAAAKVAAAAVGGATLVGTSAAAAGTAMGSPAAAPAASSTMATYEEEDEGGIGWWMIAAILLGILAMLILSWFMRTKPGLPAVAGAGVNMVAECPAGQMPASLLNVLETGSIEDDTSE
ncbi:MAG: hypothetical protein AAGF20_07495 [Pseudomonadota bacterium]